MSEITIPPEALEAGRRIFCDSNCGQDFVCKGCESQARDAFEAMVGAWPGMHTHEWQRPWLGGMSGTDLILPLTEKPDADSK